MPGTCTSVLKINFLAGFTNCRQIFDDGQLESRVYSLHDSNGASFDVYCNMSIRGEGGWTVIQQRLNNIIPFNRTWQEYRNGFGDPTSNYWIGLQKIRDILTAESSPFQLYIGMGSFHPTDTYRFAFYDSFNLGDERENYKLQVGSVSRDSSAGDSLFYHNGKQFSTPDQDNDSAPKTHCAQRFNAGWWFGNCHDSLLNGQYYDNGLLADLTVPDGIIWETWAGDRESLKSTIMAIRPL